VAGERENGKNLFLQWRDVAGYRGFSRDMQTQQQATSQAKQQQAASNKQQAKGKKGALVAIGFMPLSTTIKHLLQQQSSWFPAVLVYGLDALDGFFLTRCAQFSVPSGLAGSVLSCVPQPSGRSGFTLQISR
jgi:hypothetical protein